MDVADYIKIIVTGISFIDFLVFIWLFMSFIIYVPYKAKQKSIKIVSIFVILFFLLFKVLHIPVFLTTLPNLGIEIKGKSTILMVLTLTNITLAVVPLVLGIITAFCFKKPTQKDFDKITKKQINIIMPIYNEKPLALMKAIESVLNLDYPKELIHLYLAFDEDVSNQNSEAYTNLIDYYGLGRLDPSYRTDMLHNDMIVSICRFPHGGKKSAQYGAFKEMEKDNKNLQDSLVFFIDSDIILDQNCLSHFTYSMEKYNKSAMTGLITCITSENPSFLTFYQDIEYVSGQILWRNLEVYMGSTSCLPGAFTILHYPFIKKISSKYFNSNEYTDNLDYQRFYLGEDRYLTHLLMEVEPWKLGFCDYARCKTEAPDTLSGLLKQRRRWYLGHIANDIWMISSLKLWTTYPFLCLFNFFNNTRNTSIYIYLLYFTLLLNKDVPLFMWLLLIILPIVLNWVFILAYSIKIKRKMNFLFYICILFFQPIFSMLYMYYTIFTIRQKGWGGVRVEKKLVTIVTEK